MQLKKIVLAALAAASFAPAFAFVKTEVPVDQAELVFTAWNDKGTYTKDLGLSLASLTSTTQFNFAGAQWDAFQALGGSGTVWTLSSTSYQGDSYGPNDWTLTTSFVSKTGINVIGQEHYDRIQLITAKFNEADIIAKQRNGGVAVANHEVTVVNGQIGDVSNGTPTYFGMINNSTGINSGATLNMMSIATPGDDGGMQVLIADAAKTANFAGTTLTITTAVPEPSTYALLLAGLCAVGFVARRRQA